MSFTKNNSLSIEFLRKQKLQYSIKECVSQQCG